MANNAGSLERLALELSGALESLAARITPDLISELGLGLPASIIEDPTLIQAFQSLATEVNELPAMSTALRQAIDDDDVVTIINEGVQLLGKLRLVYQSIRELSNVLENLANTLPQIDQGVLLSFAEEFPGKLIDYAIVSYFEGKSPLAVHGLALLGLIDWRQEQIEAVGSVGPEFVRKSLRFDRLNSLLSDPNQHFLELYGWGSTTFDTPLLFETLQNLIVEGTRGAADIFKIDDQEPILEAYVFALQRKTSLVPPGLSVEFRLPVEPQLNFSEEVPLTFPWVQKLTFKATAGSVVSADVTPPDDFALSTDASDLSLDITAGFSTSQATEPFSILGVTDATQITARNFEITVAFRTEVNAATGVTLSPSFGLKLQDAQINFDVSDGDQFITQTLPTKKIDAQFSVSANWSVDKGLVFQGSGALEINVPSHADIGFAKLTSLFFKLLIGPEPNLEASASITTTLGPLTMTINRIGLTIAASFPDDRSGNVGPLDLNLDFKPPSGLGLSIDGGGFKGGGVIDFEPAEARYSGMLELEFQDQFALKAFALLNTRLPNGQVGFSLLIIISAEFTPMQLGLGFKLNGVGGLLGLNRTINIEPLRAGIRNNTLSSILFPTDIVANADRIISDLRQIFPPAADRFVFGPMARITWGTPTLITADLGLVIEIPDPVRLAILGVLKAVLPDEDAALLKLQVNFLGELDFQRNQLKFDASLFDSKLLAFNLSGDMAIRLDWGANPNFLLSVGGFHPAFQPPPMELPALRRLTLALLDGDNPRLKLELYFAVTSNTAQFGARLELYAAAWKFNVFGFLSFDVLLQFNPFYFVAQVTAMLALRVGSSSIASIKLALTLEGPTPWKAQGSASFKICWFFTLKVRFNKTFGEARNTTLPDLAVLPLVVAALQAPDNWTAELPAQRQRLESLRQALTTQLLIHPVGTLRISQRVVPLNILIDRLGSQRPTDARLFQLTNAQPAPAPLVPQEAFAPAQFFDLTDEQKLTGASFKDLDSGLNIGEAQQLHTGYAATRAVQYELKFIDSQRDQRLAGPADLVDVDPTNFHSWSLHGAVAQSQLSFARTRKSALAPPAVAVTQESFAIVTNSDLQLFDQLSLLASEAAARARLSQLLSLNPHLAGALQVIPAFELAA